MAAFRHGLKKSSLPQSLGDLVCVALFSIKAPVEAASQAPPGYRLSLE